MALNKTDNKVVKEKSSLSEGPTISNPDEALHILRSQPDIVTLTAVLRYLHSTISAIDTFNIRLPTPKTAQLLNILIGPIFSDYSNVLLPQEFLDGKERPQVIARTKISSIFLACLSSVAGLGAVEARLRALLAHGLAAKNPSHDSASLLASRGLLNLLVALLHGRGFIWKIWTDSTKLIRDDHRRQLLWGEFLCTICMGKILSVAAETLSFINAASEEPNNECWVGDGRNFARWLGRNIAHMTLEIHAETQEDWTAVGQTLQKAFSLGYTGKMPHSLIRLHWGSAESVGSVHHESLVHCQFHCSTSGELRFPIQSYRIADMRRRDCRRGLFWYFVSRKCRLDENV